MPRVMPSSTKPESVIIEVIARSSQTSVRGSDGSRLNTGSAISAVEGAPVVGRHPVAQVERDARELAQPLARAPLRGWVAARRSCRGAARRSTRQAEPPRQPRPAACGRCVRRRRRAHGRAPRAAAAPSRRSARRSGRTRTGSRPRATQAWRARPGLGRDRLRSSENEALTGASESTQVSFERPPRCIAMTRESSSAATRVRPPGITRQPPGVATANTRRPTVRAANASPAAPSSTGACETCDPLLRDIALRPARRCARRSAARSASDRSARRSAARSASARAA